MDAILGAVFFGVKKIDLEFLAHLVGGFNPS